MKLSAGQVVGLVVILMVAGSLSWKYGRRHRKDREELEQIERESRERSDRAMRNIDEIRANMPRTTGVAACDAVMKLNAAPLTCPTDAGTQALQAAKDKLLESPGPGEGAIAVCERVLAGIEDVIARENCR